MAISGIVLTTDLVVSSQISSLASARGWSIESAGTMEQVADRAAQGDVSLVLIDLRLPGLDIERAVTQFRQLASPPRAIVAFGPHVHAAKLNAAVDAGCDEVLSRGQLARAMEQLLEKYITSD